MKKPLILIPFALLLGLLNPVRAQGIPVIDGANLVQAIQQVLSWTQQLEYMQHQIKNTSGIRNMGTLAQTERLYLPLNYPEIIQNGAGAWHTIHAASKVFDISISRLDAHSASGKAFAEIARQYAINRAVAEEAYKTAGKRFAAIQTLMDRINSAPDDKDVQDLQARLSAEQVMMQNEMNRLKTLAMLAQAQRDIAMQQSAERKMAAWRGTMPTW